MFVFRSAYPKCASEFVCDVTSFWNMAVVCLVARPLSGSEAGVDLILIKTLLLFTCKSCSHANSFVFTYEKKEGLYQNKANSSLASSQRPGH